MRKIICTIATLIIIFAMGSFAEAADYVYSASVSGEVALHISPAENSYKIMDIPVCSKMKLLRTERTWGLIEFKNKCGWINLSFTRDSYDNAAEASGNDDVKNVKISTEEKKASLYNIPSLSQGAGSVEKYAVPNDTVLKITRVTRSGWGLASMNGKYAWIQMKNTAAYENSNKKADDEYGIYYVYVLSDKGKGAELYSEPGRGSLHAVIPDCTKLTVREKKKNYAYVSYDGINGWIDIAFTTQSLSNAQSNAGVEVNAEYEITPPESEDVVNMLSVPSDNPADGGYVVGSIERGTAVFVLRSTLSGWNLVNYNGALGWLPPESAVPAEFQEVDVIETLSEKRKGFVSTFEKKGVELYPEIGTEEAIATIPECIELEVVARKEGYEYVYCDYASGWIEKDQLTDSYENVLMENQDQKKQAYITSRETVLMSLPTNSELCHSEEIMLITPNTYFTVLKTVSTGKSKWGFVKIGESQGWVKLGDRKL